MMNFLFAGHETTTNATANGLLALMENRDQWDALCGDPSLATNAVEEILRYSSSVIAWRREVVDDVIIGGVTLPAGSKVLAVTGSANHDESVFPEAEKFDITRANAKRHFAFGIGRHLCIGAALARIEMQVFLEELTRRLPHMRLVAGQEFVYSPNTSFRGPEHVRVEWDPTQTRSRLTDRADTPVVDNHKDHHRAPIHRSTRADDVTAFRKHYARPTCRSSKRCPASGIKLRVRRRRPAGRRVVRLRVRSGVRRPRGAADRAGVPGGRQGRRGRRQLRHRRRHPARLRGRLSTEGRTGQSRRTPFRNRA